MELKILPGTMLALPKDKTTNAFSVIEPVLDATGGLTLRQVCDMTGLPASTIQNWVKRGWVANPDGKRYGRRQLARILLINMMKDAMQLERIVTLMAYINGSVEDERDDIIPDWRLYSMLCHILKETEGAALFSGTEVQDTVQRVAGGYHCPSSEAQKKLENTLTVMTWATLGADCRRKSEQIYQTIQT